MHLVSVEGSAEKRARQHWHAAGRQPNAEATLLAWLSTLIGNFWGKRMARCLALMRALPVAGLPSCCSLRLQASALA